MRRALRHCSRSHWLSAFRPPARETGSRLPLCGSDATGGSRANVGSAPPRSAGRPTESDRGVKGWGSTSEAKMAAVARVSLRPRFAATALGGGCLQVSPWVARRGQARRSRRWPGAEGAAEEREGAQGKAPGRGRPLPPAPCSWWFWSIPVIPLRLVAACEVVRAKTMFRNKKKVQRRTGTGQGHMASE